MSRCQLFKSLVPRSRQNAIDLVPGFAKSTPYPPCTGTVWLAKAKGFWPVLASGNTTSLYCRAVMLKPQLVTRQLRLDRKGLSITPQNRNNVINLDIFIFDDNPFHLTKHL